MSRIVRIETKTCRAPTAGARGSTIAGMRLVAALLLAAGSILGQGIEQQKNPVIVSLLDADGIPVRGLNLATSGPDFLAERYQAGVDQVEFKPGRIRVADTEITFDDAISYSGSPEEFKKQCQHEGRI